MVRKKPADDHKKVLRKKKAEYDQKGKEIKPKNKGDLIVIVED